MKILASDFDDTLFVKDESILQKNISTVKKFIAYGNIFCIITGRNYSYLKQDLQKLNIPYSYLICADGAQIFNNVDYCISSTYLSPEKIEEVSKILEEFNCKYYLDDGYNATTNINDCIKIVGYLENIAISPLLEKLKQLDVYAYVSTKHLNIIDSSVNKLNSLKKLLELENLPKESLYVIGDEVNDLEMLQEFKGAIMEKHNEILDTLHKKEYPNLYNYIEDLSKN